VMFCLYGERRLSQDEEIAVEEIFLVNSAAMQDCAADPKNPVEAHVELSFEHKSEAYQITRKILGMFDGKRRIEQIDKVLLSHWKSDGNIETFTDPDEISRVVNGILDSNVREYFLFDGEKIQRLTLASLKQRKEVAKGIRNLLNIEALEKAIRAVQKLAKNLNLELGKKATGEYAKIIYQINELTEKQSANHNKIKEIEDELSLSEIEKRSIDKKLEEYKEIIHLLKEREGLEDALRYEEDQARNLLSEMKTKTGRASLLLVSETVDRVFKIIDEKKQKGEIPSEIRKDLIERILLENQCICGREVLPGTEAFQHIILWKNKTDEMELESSALDIWRYLGSIKNHRDDISGALETLLMRYGNSKNTIETLRQKIEQLNNQIGSSERKDAVDLEKTRENIEKKQIKLEAERITLQDELTSSDSELKRLAEQRKIVEQQENIKNELSQRVQLADSTQEALQEVYKDFTEEMKEKITAHANRYFSELLDKEGRETLHGIVVNSDYSLQIYDRWGKPFLANISAGQRQIMSISFIAALARVAAPDGTLKMPLFMDTPLGRLSLDHRKNLLEKLPRLGAQWILLVTDTEFGNKEGQLLRESGKWGRFYVLEGAGPGITIIKEKDVNSAQSILASKLEGNI